MNISVKISMQQSALENRIKELETTLETAKIELEESKKELFEISMRSLYIQEIYRLAKHHFPRLRREKSLELSEGDIQELDKWILRAKSPDSLKAIVEALQEMEKYRPIDIRGNLYALVQKIILGGSFHGKKK